MRRNALQLFVDAFPLQDPDATQVRHQPSALAVSMITIIIGIGSAGSAVGDRWYHIHCVRCTAPAGGAHHRPARD